MVFERQLEEKDIGRTQAFKPSKISTQSHKGQQRRSHTDRVSDRRPEQLRVMGKPEQVDVEYGLCNSISGCIMTDYVMYIDAHMDLD